MPTTIIGARVHGRPNYLAVAWCNIVNQNPPYVCIALSKRHYTNAGIHQNRSFSVNIPSAAMARETDYCGIYSGAKTDKSQLFQAFYGKLKTTPMVSECPLNIECRLLRVIDIVDHELFIGEIIAVYADADCLENGKPDAGKINPLIFSRADNNYFALGDAVAPAWQVGRER
jgi:flavin reductase (DIM6/NTAB) family NADH-FMN oxidoreductase RutF